MWKGKTYDRNVELLDEEMRSWFKHEKVDTKVQGHLTMSRLRNKGSLFPKLKAKGAATRHLIKCVLDLARRHIGDRRVLAVAQLMTEFYTLIDNEGLYLSEPAKERAPHIGRNFCSIYAQLSRSALENKVKAWKATPKFHLFCHLTEWQMPDLGLNPRFY